MPLKIEKSLNWLGYCYMRILPDNKTEEKMLNIGLVDLIHGYVSSDELKQYYIVFDGHFADSGFEPRGEHYINCGENEDLFLAIAALRNDTDYMQWFVSDGAVDGQNCQSEWWIQSTQDKFVSQDSKITWRKATEEELIKHFLK